MVTTDLINNNIPQLQLQDKIVKALQLIADFHVTHLPVVAQGKYVGLISEEDLLDAESENQLIESLETFFIPQFVTETDHFLNAVKFANQHESSVVPIVNEQKELLGTATVSELLKSLGNFSGADEIGGIIVMEMERHQFAISEISRIVESNDATILHLNTTTHPVSGILTVTLHVNKREIAPIVATFERYEYTITFYNGDQSLENEVSGNYKHLMNYLDI